MEGDTFTHKINSRTKKIIPNNTEMKKFISLLIDSYHFRSKINFLNLFKLTYLKNRKSEKLVEFKLKNVKSIIYARPNTSDFTLIRNILLEQEYPIFKDYNPRFIIDAGANIGLSCIYFKNNYPEAKIIAIEPEKSNCNLFLKNTSRYPDIILLEGALLNESNIETTITNLTDEKYSFRIDRSKKAKKLDDSSVISYSINQLIERYNIENINILKLDIEGSEKDVFSSNLEWLNITDNILIELHELLSPGCGHVLINAIANQHIKIRFKGENLVLSKNRMAFK